MASLDIEGVSQGFGDIKVLDAINLHVESGQVACLLGPSGCGKTTLFHVIAGLSRPWSGRVLLDGRDMLGLFGLEGTQDRWPAELSGGMRQRAALLRSYLFSREFMLLDEPCSALVAFTKADMHVWLLYVGDTCGTTALVVTPDIDEAIKLADIIYVMRGAPQRGEAACIVGSEAIDCPRAARSEFALSGEFLDHKRRILDLLG